MPKKCGTDKVDARRLQSDVLRAVSRSFYLSVKVLPHGMREPVAVAYLLARIADTIADTDAIPMPRRLDRLRTFRACVAGEFSSDTDLEISRDDGVGADAPPADSTLLENANQVLRLLESLPPGDGESVRRVVATLITGMEVDLQTFRAPEDGSLASFDSAEDLDRYVYLVAGCVGEFWTSVGMAHQPRMRGWNADEMAALGVRYGKALQLTNVLRDVAADVRTGRCYLPSTELSTLGLAPADLLQPSSSGRARQVLGPWIRVALGHFEAAEAYALAVPRRCVRLRLATLWPMLLGLATLERLASNDDWLSLERRSRVSRRWVYGMMARSAAMVFSDGLLRSWIRGLRKKVERSLR